MTSYVEPTAASIAQEIPGLPQDLLDLYTLLALVKGTRTTLEDVHDAWAVWRAATNPTHKSLVPFDQLTADVQELDRPYRDAIVHAAENARR